jgi:hypothetical protein
MTETKKEKILSLVLVIAAWISAIVMAVAVYFKIRAFVR